jgi:hypothetical protein
MGTQYNDVNTPFPSAVDNFRFRVALVKAGGHPEASGSQSLGGLLDQLLRLRLFPFGCGGEFGMVTSHLARLQGRRLLQHIEHENLHIPRLKLRHHGAYYHV